MGGNVAGFRLPEDHKPVRTDIPDAYERLAVSDSWRSEITHNYGSGSSYALGAATSVQSYDYKNNSYQFSTTTTNSFQWWDGAVQSQVSFAKTNQSTYYTYYYYSAAGHLDSVRINDGRPRTVTFTNDMNGQAIRRDEADNLSGGDPHEVWYRFAGKEMAFAGNNGTLDTNYGQSIQNRTAVPPASPGAFRNGATNASHHADIGMSLEAINSYNQGSTSGGYTVRGGETLASIASNLWGDSSLWYKLAEANGLSGAGGLVEGQRLTIPAGVMRNTHNASTFTPYDPSDAMGELSPTNPKAPKKNKCGMFGQILLVAVAVAVSAITYGALTGPTTGLLGAIFAGAASGAAGSVASQGLGVAAGIQDKFSFKGVAMAAVAGGVGGGLGKFAQLAGEAGKMSKNLASIGKFLGGGGFANGAARGAISSIVTQGIGVATGLQKKFKFVGVAAAAAGGGAANLAGGWLGNASKQIARTGASAAAAIANAATRSALSGTSFGDNLLAALPDVIGSTIGNMVADPVVEKIRLGQLDDLYKEALQTPEGEQAALILAGGVAPGENRRAVAERITANLMRGTDGKSVADTRRIIERNITGYLDHVGRGQRSVYQSALAQNSALVTIYAAIGLVMPEFQWTHVGAFVAHQVRREIINVYEMATNTADFARHLRNSIDYVAELIPGGNAAEAGAMLTEMGATGARDHIIGKIIEGQRTVVTDIVSMALTYKLHGAYETAQVLTREARRGFMLQHQADRLWGQGRRAESRAVASQAAYQLGIHEQKRLQNMWNDPLLSVMGTVGSMVGAVNTSIFVGVSEGRRDGAFVGNIQAPGSGRWNTVLGLRVWQSPLNVTRLGDRLTIARNAFDWMQGFVHSNPGNKATVERGLGLLLDQNNHARSRPRI